MRKSGPFIENLAALHKLIKTKVDVGAGWLFVTATDTS
jgi:hypothetical protein